MSLGEKSTKFGMEVPCLVPEQEISLAIQVSAIFKMAATIFKMTSGCSGFIGRERPKFRAVTAA